MYGSYNGWIGVKMASSSTTFDLDGHDAWKKRTKKNILQNGGGEFDGVSSSHGTIPMR